MLVVSKDFIEDNLLIIKKQSGNTYKADEIFTYLKRAYLQLQKDYPLFKKSLEITTIDDTLEYSLDDEIIDIDSLSINTRVHTKRRIDKFQDLYSSQRCNDDMYAIEFNTLYIYPKTKANETIKLFCSYVKEVETDITKEFEIPLLLKESLRYGMLAKFFEEQPKRNGDSYIDMEKHYQKLYEKEIVYAKRQLKTRHRNVTTTYKKI